jgi:transposase
VGKIVQEARVASEPEALLQVLTNTIYRFKRVGLEAGPLSQWLYSVLAEAGLPVICVETQHMRAMLKAQINKTDRNDARGIAQMMRVGLYRPVHVKTLRSQKLRMTASLARSLEHVFSSVFVFGFWAQVSSGLARINWVADNVSASR